MPPRKPRVTDNTILYIEIGCKNVSKCQKGKPCEMVTHILDYLKRNKVEKKIEVSCVPEGYKVLLWNGK